MERHIKMDKNVLIPSRKAYKGRYPWPYMEVGDSHLKPAEFSDGYFRAFASQAGKRLGRKFSVRKTPEGLRVWRIA